jgi:hypothetical protein
VFPDELARHQVSVSAIAVAPVSPVAGDADDAFPDRGAALAARNQWREIVKKCTP